MIDELNIPVKYDHPDKVASLEGTPDYYYISAHDYNVLVDKANEVVQEINAVPGYISNAINQVIDGAPADYNTLNKIATKLSAVISLVGSSGADADTIVNTVAEVLAVFQNYPEGLNLLTALSGKVNTSDIINNLTQVASGKVLDASQGKALKDALDALTSNAIVSGSDSSYTVKSLSAVAAYPGSPIANRMYFVQTSEFYGAVSVTADGTSVVKIAHGQSFTPSFFMVRNLNSAANGIVSSSIDATFITLNYPSNITSGTALSYMLMWKQ